MLQWLTEALEGMCMFFYALLIFRIWISYDAYFFTPFYTFFITTGACGILSVVSLMTGTHVNFTEQWAWIFKVCWIVNHIGAIGSLLGKLIISFNRYSVLRCSDLVENEWKRSFTYRLMAIQLLVPCITAIRIFFYDYKYEMRNGVPVAYTFTDSGVVSSKIVTTTYYIIYVVVSIILTVLTSRALAELSGRIGEGNTKQQILRHQKTMFVIVSICMISHFIKAVHQAIWGVATLLGQPQLADAIYPYYPYVNGLATYAAPVVLIVCSSRVRHLFLPRHFTYSSSAETTTSALRSTSNNQIHPA